MPSKLHSFNSSLLLLFSLKDPVGRTQSCHAQEDANRKKHHPLFYPEFKDIVFNEDGEVCEYSI